MDIVEKKSEKIIEKIVEKIKRNLCNEEVFSLKKSIL